MRENERGEQSPQTPYDVRGLYKMYKSLLFSIFNYKLFEVNGSVWRALKSKNGLNCLGINVTPISPNPVLKDEACI